MPFAASNPHFYGRYPNPLTSKLEGFRPEKDRHQSYIIVEPVMGVPIDQSARSQSNVIIPELHGYNEQITRFSNMALPTFWVEYVSFFLNCKSVIQTIPFIYFGFKLNLLFFRFQHQRQLTSDIENLIYFTLYILPIILHLITGLLLVGGSALTARGVLRLLPIENQWFFGQRKSSTSKYKANCKLHENSLTWSQPEKTHYIQA